MANMDGGEDREAAAKLAQQVSPVSEWPLQTTFAVKLSLFLSSNRLSDKTDGSAMILPLYDTTELQALSPLSI